MELTTRFSGTGTFLEIEVNEARSKKICKRTKKKKIITVENMYIENLIKEKRKNKSIPRKEIS